MIFRKGWLIGIAVSSACVSSPSSSPTVAGPVPVSNASIPRTGIEFPVLASRWVKIDSNEKAQFYFDSTQIVRSAPATVSVWTQSLEKYVDVSGPAVQRSVMKWETDCSARRQRIVSLTNYWPDGRVFRSADFPDAAWGTIVPETRGELLARIFCR